LLPVPAGGRAANGVSVLSMFLRL